MDKTKQPESLSQTRGHALRHPTGRVTSAKITLFGMAIDAIERRDAVRCVLRWLADGRQTAKIVVTPNVDHVVQYQRNEDFRNAYRAASLVVADGVPVVWASRLLGAPLPERVNGCDLVEDLLSAIALTNLRASVYLLGAPPGVAQRAAEKIMARWKGLEVRGAYSPPQGFEKDPDESAKIIDQINAVSPDVLVVGLGAPKQEIWAATNASRVHAKVILCVGATIDYLAAAKKRAPTWMQRTGLEWAFRLASEPGRLWRRYGRDVLMFPPLVLKEWAAHHRSHPHP